MKKLVSIGILLVVICSLSACKASKSDVEKADDFITGLSSFESAEPADEIDELADLSAAVINLDAKAFDFNDGWEKRKNENEKYLVIFDSDATLTLYLRYGKINRVDYTIRVDSVKEMYASADNLISIYGEPESVYLNGAASTHSAVDRATNNSDDPELTYSYVWKTELQGKSMYIYEAYYDASGINFAYIIVSDFLKVADIPQSMWSN